MDTVYKFDPKLMEIAEKGKGIFAALDQSAVSTPGALATYGIPESEYSSGGVRDAGKMFDFIHGLRTRVVTSPVFTKEKILGTIITEETLDRKFEGLKAPEYLLKKGILTFLKIDKGMLRKERGVMLLKDIEALDPTLEKAKKAGIFGTRTRSLVASFDEDGIVGAVEQQFVLAERVLEHGLVPIIDIETIGDDPSDRIKCEHLLHNLIFERVMRLDSSARIILAVSMPVDETIYEELNDDERVLMILSPSSGMTRIEACINLKKRPGLVACFCRPLLQDLRHDFSDEGFNNILSDSIDMAYSASFEKHGD